MRRRAPSDALFPYTTLFRSRSLLVAGGEEDAELVALRAELDARAAREGLDERTGKELLLNLRERSEEHTSELQSRLQPVCRPLLGEKKATPPWKPSSLLLSD